MTRRKRPRPHPTGGSTRHPASLANLRNRPPAPPAGNTRAATHYGRAEITIPGLDAARQDIYDQLAASAPVRDAGQLPAADEATVELAARALARHRSVDNWLAVHGVLDEKTGEPIKAAEYAESSARTADLLLAKLGMNPKDRAALGLDVARASQFDLAAHWAESEDDGARPPMGDTIDAEAEEEGE